MCALNYQNNNPYCRHSSRMSRATQTTVGYAPFSFLIMQVLRLLVATYSGHSLLLIDELQSVNSSSKSQGELASVR